MKRVSLILTLALAGGLSTQAATAQTLKTVKDRGMLSCGVSQGLPGFSSPDDKGNWTGIDVDVCRAIAAAIFNDPTKVKFPAQVEISASTCEVRSRYSLELVTPEKISSICPRLCSLSDVPPAGIAAETPIRPNGASGRVICST